MAASIDTANEAVPLPSKVSNRVNIAQDMDDHNDTSTSSISEEFLNLTSNSVSSTNGNLDHSELNGHHESNEHEELSVKSEKNKMDNVKLAANFNGSPIIVSEELNLSSSETELITKVVLDECDEVPMVNGGKTNNRSVETLSTKPMVDATPAAQIETPSPANGMADSYIKSVDDVPLTESYIKISLTDESKSLDETSPPSLDNPPQENSPQPTTAESVLETSTSTEPEKEESPLEEVVKQEAISESHVAESEIKVADVPKTLAEPEPEATAYTEAAEIVHVEGGAVVGDETVQGTVDVPPATGDVKAEEDPSAVANQEKTSTSAELSSTLSDTPLQESMLGDNKSPLEAAEKPVTEPPATVADVVDVMTASEKIEELMNTVPVMGESNNVSVVEKLVPECEAKAEAKVEPDIEDKVEAKVEAEVEANVEAEINVAEVVSENLPAVSEPEKEIQQAAKKIEDLTNVSSSISNTEDTTSETAVTVEESSTIVDVSTTESVISDTTNPAEIVDKSVTESSATVATEPVQAKSDDVSVPDTKLPVVDLAQVPTSKPEDVVQESTSADIPTPVETSEMESKTQVETPVVEKKTETVDASETKASPAVKSEPEAEPGVAPVVEEWLDILGNGLLKKKVLVKGKGEETRPKSRNTVTVRCEGKLKDGTIVDKHDQLKFILSDQDVIQALDLAVGLMEDGETALVFTDAKYAYGVQGKKDMKPPIPQNASITYEIQILSIAEGPDLKNLTDEERVQYGDQKRIRGNDLYSTDDFNGAISLYSRGIKYLEGSDNKSVMDMKIKCLNNLSAAQLKVKAYKSAIASLDTVLQFEPENVKALFRKGKCLDGMKKEAEALECIKKASALDPNNKQLRQEVERLKSAVNATKKKEAAMYQKMFNEKPLDKLAQEEEERSWMLKMMSGGVLLLGFIAGYLQWRR